MNHDPSPRHPGNNTPSPRPQIYLEELQRHMANQLCFFCHLLGHLSRHFPRCSTQNDASVAAINTSSQSYSAILIKILQEKQCIEVEAMLNTGATSNFIDPCLAQQLGLTTSDTPTVVTISNNTTDTARQSVAPANIELGGVTTQLELLLMKNIP
ncbi:hypothetical protein DSO57_1032572 [Entomophthora muscae]|uniref:Uncharacterized protein n=1 Tax=Entomophthora muscae TaxID=34485 RepID=A0ACC2TML3_9FUNG|nr:hypothetical protein DSO57_1032572 [Entomophthora muscae]